MPRTWVEWKCKASILNNQWRGFNATCPQMMMSKNPTPSTMTPTCSASLHSILYLLTHAPCPQQQVSCRPTTHGLGSYEVQVSWDTLQVDLVPSDDCYHLPIPPLFQSDPVHLSYRYYFLLFP